MKRCTLLLGALCALTILTVIPRPASAPQQRQQDFGDFVGNYNFRVEIDGVDAGSFSSVDGLSVQQEVVEYQSGSDRVVRKRPGRVKYGNITLKRGYVADSDLYDWIDRATKDPDMPTSGVTVEFLGPSGADETLRVEYFECFPSSWSLGEESGVEGPPRLTESLTIACDTMVVGPKR